MHPRLVHRLLRRGAAVCAAPLVALVVVAGMAAAAPVQARNGVIAFLDDRAADRGGEIYVVPTRGGRALSASRSSGPDSDPAVSPDGRRIAFFGARNGFTALYVARWDGTGPRRVGGRYRGEQEGLLASSGLTWSRDGRWLAASDPSGRVRVIAARGGGGWSVGKGFGPSWSSEGTRLAYSISVGRGPAGLRVVVVTRQGRRLWTRRGTDAAWSPRGSKVSIAGAGRSVVTDARGRTLATYGGRFLGWSPDGERIALDCGPRGALCVASWRGRRVRRLADAASGFAWAPDGRRVAFNGRRLGRLGVWVTSVGSGRTRRLAAPPGRVLDWSRNGAWVLLAAGQPPNDVGPRELFAVGVAGTSRRVARAAAGSVFSHAAFADGGRAVVYRSSHTGGAEIHTVQPDGRGVRQVTRDGSAKLELAWSPDGTALAYAAADVVGRCHGCPFTLVVRDFRTGVTRDVADLGSDSTGQASWAPDGTRIAFVDETGDGFSIFLVRPDGSSRAELVRGGWAPTWSPDGRRIAYVDVVRRRLVIIDADGTNARSVVEGDAYGPAWSPDGRWIAYYNNASIRAVRPDGGGDHLVLPAQAPSGLSWSPDGEWIAYSSRAAVFVARADGSGARRITSGADPAWQPLL